MGSARLGWGGNFLYRLRTYRGVQDVSDSGFGYLRIAEKLDSSRVKCQVEMLFGQPIATAAA